MQGLVLALRRALACLARSHLVAAVSSEDFRRSSGGWRLGSNSGTPGFQGPFEFRKQPARGLFAKLKQYVRETQLVEKGPHEGPFLLFAAGLILSSHGGSGLKVLGALRRYVFPASKSSRGGGTHCVFVPIAVGARTTRLAARDQDKGVSVSRGT